ncbi:MAG: molybdenum cofactor biosynthesis protein MoaE [Pseudomonadota bacterium]
MISVRIADAAFDPYQALALFQRGHTESGAVASFIGLVRNQNDDKPVATLSLSHYPAMTEKKLLGFAETANNRWQIDRVLVIHRVGDMAPGDPIVLVACASAHRADAFAATEYLMDKLKTEAPFWKAEIAPDGARRWVDAREVDNERATRWDSVDK